MVETLCQKMFMLTKESTTVFTQHCQVSLFVFSKHLPQGMADSSLKDLKCISQSAYENHKMEIAEYILCPLISRARMCFFC